jgi:hypothetical protein
MAFLEILPVLSPPVVNRLNESVVMKLHRETQDDRE